MKMFKKYKIVIFSLVIVAFFFLSANFVFAQECNVENNGCTSSGLQLSALLENHGVTFSLIAVAGLLDGINPCAIGMLILLLGYLLVFAKEHKKMVKLGLIYIVVIFITYFLIGIAFSSVIKQLLAWPPYHEVAYIIKWVIVVLIWVAALINIKDVFWYGKGFSLGVSKSEVPVLMKLIKKVDWQATVLLGFVVTIFELPCSLPLYVGSIALMSQSFSHLVTIGYLLLYDFMFIAPLIAVFAILVKTHHIFEAKDIQERANKWMKLSMAVAQILIGVGLLLLGS